MQLSTFSMHKIKPGIRWGPLEYLLTDEQKQEVTAGIIQYLRDLHEKQKRDREDRLIYDAECRLKSADPCD